MIGTSTITFAQNDSTEDPKETMDDAMKELNGLLDSMDFTKMLGEDFSGLFGQLNFGDGQMMQLDSLLGGSGGSFGILNEMFSEMDQGQMNQMLEQSMQMLQGMDMSQFNHMFEQFDMKDLEKMFEGMELDEFKGMFPTAPPADSKEKKNDKLKKL